MAEEQQQQEPSTPSNPRIPTPSRLTEVGGTSPDENIRKIFIGGLPHFITREEIVDYFNRFGAVVEGTVVVDQFTGQGSRVWICLVQLGRRGRYHNLKGKQIEAERAFPINGASNGTINNKYNRQGSANSGHHGCVYSSFHGFNGYDLHNYVNAYERYNGWVSDKWMNGSGYQSYHRYYRCYVQNLRPPTPPNGHFVSANGNGSSIIMTNGYGHGLRNGITKSKRTFADSSVDPPEVVAGDGEAESNGSVPAPESVINGAAEEQQPAKVGKEESGQVDFLVETSRVEAGGVPAQEDNGSGV